MSTFLDNGAERVTEMGLKRCSERLNGITFPDTSRQGILEEGIVDTGEDLLVLLSYNF